MTLANVGKRTWKGTYKLIEGDLRSMLIQHEPPDIAKHSGGTHIGANDHVSEEQPPTNQCFISLPWRPVHDVVIRWIERERSRRKPVSDKVHPQELHWNESLRHA